MMSPFSETLPSFFWPSGCALGAFFLLSLLCQEGRASAGVGVLVGLSGLLPKWMMLISSGMTVAMGGLLMTTALSLVPLSLTVFHYPTLGVGLSISLWVTVVFLSLVYRFTQFLKEYFTDPSLSSWWAMLCVLIESGSRGVRSVTLGGRISVNIMMGSILYSVVGEMGGSWGLFILCGLELLVVLVQTYVFILLVCFYSAEIE